MKLSKQEKEMVKCFDEEFVHDRSWAIHDCGNCVQPKEVKAFLLKEVRKAEKRGRKEEAKKYGDFVVLMNEILLEENNPKLSHLKSLINNK